MAADVHVFHRTDQDWPYGVPARARTHPWMLQYASGKLRYFRTERAAAAAQRAYRRRHGLDPITGESR